MRGRVVDEDGRPIAGAEFSLPHWTWHSGTRRSCRLHEWSTVDVDGSIEWREEGPVGPLLGDHELFRVAVRAAGFVAHIEPWRRLDPDTDVGTIVLVRGERIEGVVRDGDGAPAADVKLQLAPDADGIDEDWVAEARRAALATRADGSFSFDGLAPGRYRVHVDLPDAPPATVVVAGTLDAVIVVPRAALPRRVAVNVVALDASGAPFCGDADASLHDGGRVVSEALVEGRATIEIAAAVGAELAVIDCDTDERFIFEDVATRDEPYVVQFGRSPTIRGRVFGDPGEPPIDVHDRSVRAFPDPCDGSSTTAPVHDDGTFAVAVPREGRYRLCFGYVASRWARAGESDVVIRVPAASSLETLPLTVCLAENRVARDFELEAVDEIDGFHMAFRTSNGPDVHGLPPGRAWRVTIRVQDEDGEWFGPTTLDGVRSGGPPIDVALAPSPTIDGVVVRRDGTPVVRAKVRAGANAAPLVSEATTGLDGRFRLVGLAPGEWTLTAETDALATSPWLVVAAGSHDVRVVATPRRAPF